MSGRGVDNIYTSNTPHIMGSREGLAERKMDNESWDLDDLCIHRPEITQFRSQTLKHVVKHLSHFEV